MKICLVNPKSLNEVELSIPHGLLQISAELKKNGYICEILDFNNPDVKLSYSYLKKFDVVGLSVMTTQLRHATEIANSLDKNERVVWGGVHCLLDPLSIVNRYSNHFVVSGDGEQPLLRLLEYFKEEKDFDFIRNQEGISFYYNGPVINSPFFVKDLNTLKNIDYYDLPDFEKYCCKTFPFFEEPRIINTLSILTSRGCSWDCSFCINSIYRKHKAFHRSKSIKKIKEETRKVIEDFNIKLVVLQDEDFFINRELVEQWKGYAHEKGFLWGADCRYNYFKENLINEEKLKDLLDSGLCFVGMSIEAGAENIRNRVLNKQLKNSDIYRTVEIIKKGAGKNLAINTSFIVDFPGDTTSNKIKIIQWMHYLSKNLNIAFSGPQIYRPYPGSKLYLLYKKHEDGNIDYYLNEITGVGASKISIIKYFKMLFYSNLLPRYFNRKFKFFRLEQTNEKKMPSKKIINKKVLKVENLLVALSFLPIRFRLKFNYWGFFFEPLLMGLFFYPLHRLKQALNRI